MSFKGIVEIITGVVTALSTAATAVFSIYRFFKRKNQVKKDKNRLLDDLQNLYSALLGIDNYDVYLIDSNNVVTLAYYVLSYRNYLSYEEYILLQRRIREFEGIDGVSYVTKLRPVVKKFLSDVKGMIDDRIK